jgi:predicted phosphodiesterase
MTVERGPHPLRRAGIIGDLHGEHVLLQRLLDEFERAGADASLCVGDIVDGDGDVNQCCTILEERGVYTVAGNHDRWLLSDERRDLPDATPPSAVSARSRAFLETLPVKRHFETLRGRLMLCHGVGDDDMAQVKADHLRFDLAQNRALTRVLRGAPCDFMVAGHTHQTMVRRVEHLTVINAGTLYRRYEQGAALIDFELNRVQFYSLAGGRPRVHETVELPSSEERSSVQAIALGAKLNESSG